METIKNSVIEKVVCTYDGICTIYFYNKPPRELEIGCSVYNAQYGVPVSEDGRKLFVGSWEKAMGGLKKGIMAYEIETGTLLWHLQEGRIRSIFVYRKYLIAIKADAAVLKIDVDTGKVLGQIKSGTIDCAYNLCSPYILVNTIRGVLSVLDTQRMNVVKKYSAKKVNPNNALSCVIRDVALCGNELVIFGFEDGQHNAASSIEFEISNQKNFARVIDNEFIAI